MGERPGLNVEDLQFDQDLSITVNDRGWDSNTESDDGLELGGKLCNELLRYCFCIDLAGLVWLYDQINVFW